MQSIENGDYFDFLVQITQIPYGWDDIIWVSYTRNDADLNRFAENEIIEIYGEISGVQSYETVLGTTKSVPYIKAKYIDKGYVIAN